MYFVVHNLSKMDVVLFFNNILKHEELNIQWFTVRKRFLLRVFTGELL